MSTKYLVHHGYNESKASAETQNVRSTHEVTRYLSRTTQVWSWEGGDAIVIGGHCSWVVIRVESTVKVLRCNSVREAMTIMGLAAKEYEVTDERSLEYINVLQQPRVDHSKSAMRKFS